MATITSPRLYTNSQYSFYNDSRFGPGNSLYINNAVVVNKGNDLKTGVSNPNWRQQVQRKQDASTSYTRVGTRVTPLYMIGNWFEPYEFNGTTYWYHGFNRLVQTGDGFDMISDGDDLALRDIALGRLKKRLSSGIGGFNALAPTVELREMRELIHQIAGSGTKLIKALIAIKKTRGASAYRFASEAWLAWSFAIKPTLHDVKSASEAVNSYLTRSDLHLRLFGTASKQWVSSADYGNSAGIYPDISWNRVGRAKHTLSYRYACALDLYLRSGNNYGASDHFGLEVESLPSTAWELFPFSWLVDYFATVGPFLDDTFVVPPGSTRYLILQKKYTMECEIVGRHVSSNRRAFGHDQMVPGSLFYTRYDRTPLASLPHLSLRLKTTDEIGKGAVNKLLNLASILGSSRRR